MNTKSWSKKLIQRLIFLALFLCAAGSAFTQTSALRRNGKIAFTSYRDGNQEIYVMNPDGSNQTRLEPLLVLARRFQFLRRRS